MALRGLLRHLSHDRARILGEPGRDPVPDSSSAHRLVGDGGRPPPRRLRARGRDGHRRGSTTRVACWRAARLVLFGVGADRRSRADGGEQLVGRASGPRGVTLLEAHAGAGRRRGDRRAPVGRARVGRLPARPRARSSSAGARSCSRPRRAPRRVLVRVDFASYRDHRSTSSRLRGRRSSRGRLLVLDFLRGELGLTGTHVGCEHGVCGACTVWLWNGRVRPLVHHARGAGRRWHSSCLRWRACGRLEGCAPSRSSRRFWRSTGSSAASARPGSSCRSNQAPARAEPSDPTDEGDQGHARWGYLCRCTGYQAIVAAVLLRRLPLRRWLAMTIAGSTRRVCTRSSTPTPSSSASRRGSSSQRGRSGMATTASCCSATSPATSTVRWSESGGAGDWRRPSGHANGLVYDTRVPAGSACEHDRSVVTRTEARRERWAVVASHYGGKELNSPNDVCVCRGRKPSASPTRTRRAGRTDWGIEREAQLDFRGVFLRVSPGDSRARRC